MPDMNQLALAVAKALRGPLYEVPTNSRYTLEELREINWKRCSTQEQMYLLRQATAAILQFCSGTPAAVGLSTTAPLSHLPQYEMKFAERPYASLTDAELVRTRRAALEDGTELGRIAQLNSEMHYRGHR